MSLLTPVRYPVKYYKWDDGQAPQLTDADGVIKTILKACLVTGYGDKAGAGWAARFEDDSRIVLRRPLQIGNPPDIKIENGVVSGKASHRIVLQNNPSGLDDANELVTTFMNARDNRCGQEWHLIATDFAFILCYQMLQYSPKNEKNYAMFIGSMQGVSKSAPLGFYMFADAEIQQNGTPRNRTNAKMLFSGGGGIKSSSNVLNKQIIQMDTNEYYETINNDYFIFSPILPFDAIKVIPPFFLSVGRYSDSVDARKTLLVSIDGRPMLRYVNKLWSSPGRVAYIPLDYWEL